MPSYALVALIVALSDYVAPGASGSPERGSARYPTIGYAAIRGWRTLVAVQRLFSMFPRGLPGLALVLLRASVAIALLIEAYSHRQELSVWLQAAAILISIALSLGFLTPIAAVLALVLHAFIAFGFGVGGVAVTVALSLDAVALALLGPGAYSIDSYRFGRRVVVLPPN